MLVLKGFFFFFYSIQIINLLEKPNNLNSKLPENWFWWKTFQGRYKKITNFTTLCAFKCTLFEYFVFFFVFNRKLDIERNASKSVCQKHTVSLINLMESKKQIMKNLYYKSGLFYFFIICRAKRKKNNTW